MAIRVHSAALRTLTCSIQAHYLRPALVVPISLSAQRRQASTASANRPLYPSVVALLHANGLSESDAASITATGPGGRLLKGDILAHLGNIHKEYPSESANRIKVLGKLDLSNIDLAATAPPVPTSSVPDSIPAQESPATDALEKLSITIDMMPVFELQDRISTNLGIDMPVATLLDRATALANRNLPAAAQTTNSMTADDLFDAVLGLPTSPRPRNGAFVPILESIAPSHSAPATHARSTQPPAASRDLFDDILGGLTQRDQPAAPTTWTNNAASDPSSAESVFSVIAARGEGLRAEAFLSQIKTVLETEPGSLVL